MRNCVRILVSAALIAFVVGPSWAAEKYTFTKHKRELAAEMKMNPGDGKREFAHSMYRDTEMKASPGFDIVEERGKSECMKACTKAAQEARKECKATTEEESEERTACLRKVQEDFLTCAGACRDTEEEEEQ